MKKFLRKCAALMAAVMVMAAGATSAYAAEWAMEAGPGVQLTFSSAPTGESRTVTMLYIDARSTNKLIEQTEVNPEQFAVGTSVTMPGLLVDGSCRILPLIEGDTVYSNGSYANGTGNAEDIIRVNEGGTHTFYTAGLYALDIDIEPTGYVVEIVDGAVPAQPAATPTQPAAAPAAVPAQPAATPAQPTSIPATAIAPATAPAQIAPAVSGTGIAVVDNCYFLNIRRSPSLDSAPFAYIAKGDTVTILETQSKWYKVSTVKGEGWVDSTYLTAQ